MMNFESQLHFYETFPKDFFNLQQDLLIIDTQVDQQQPQLAKNFKYVYRVQAGESLKSLALFAQHVEAVLELWQEPLSRQSCIVSCGGGSVGDFCGFLASILKRGLRLIHCPTTWLSAIDSAHGGKTALNVKSIKNQVGTFYPAESIILVKEVLFSAQGERAREGLSEMIKIALTSNPSFFTDLQMTSNVSLQELIWLHLEKAIAAKNRIVKQDPFETTGVRKVLNFGHTLGHVIESHYQASHGESVLQGLYFAIEWSAKSGLLSELQRKNIFNQMHSLGLQCWLEKNDFLPMSSRRLQEIVMHDKKMNKDAKIDFVFLTQIGIPQVIAVTPEELVLEAKRQGWARDV